MTSIPRAGSGELPPDFGTKVVYIPRSRPLRHRAWFRWLVFGMSVAFLLVVIVGGAVVYDWRRSIREDLAAQRRSLEAFLHSREFAQLVQSVDAQFVAAMNYAALYPGEASRAFPVVAAHESLRHELPWSIDLWPLPIAAAGEPARVMRAGREASALLAQRNWQPGATDLKAARTLFLRLLAPHARAFLQRNSGHGFNALLLDYAMQNEALAAFAARHGPDVSQRDAERMFCFYAAIGPAMWRAIERDRDARAKTTFAASTR